MTNSRKIGFISTRFEGTDGVSLETAKWAEVLQRMGHECYYFCGQCDRPPERSFVIPEAFYRHPVIDAINEEVYNGPWGQLHENRKAHPEIEALHQDFFSVFIRPAKITKTIAGIKRKFQGASLSICSKIPAGSIDRRERINHTDQLTAWSGDH